MSADLVGRTIGGCRVDRLLGRGGMSATWLGHHLGFDRQVVIKTLDPQRAWGRTGLVEAFLREGKALAAVINPHVVRVLLAGAEQSVPFLVLEYVPGVTLRARLREERLELDEALGVVLDAARGLGAAHAAGIVHGDVKPENLLLDEEERIKVSDFGLARWAGEPVAGKSGALYGTPAYMSPEHCRGEALDARADVYALGVVLFECLLDRWPFNAPEPRQLLVKQLEEAPPLEELRAAGVAAPLVQLVGRCLDKDPDRRPADGAALAAQLEALSRGADRPRRRKRRRARSSSSHRIALGRSSAHPARRRGGGSAVIVIVIVLAVAAVGAWLLLSQR